MTLLTRLQTSSNAAIAIWTVLSSTSGGQMPAQQLGSVGRDSGFHETHQPVKRAVRDGRAGAVDGRPWSVLSQNFPEYPGRRVGCGLSLRVFDPRSEPADGGLIPSSVIRCRIKSTLTEPYHHEAPDEFRLFVTNLSRA
jgi:hypothetical protein